MGYSGLTVIKSGFLDLNEVNLGVLVPHPAEPGMDFWPQTPPVFAPDDIQHRELKHIHEFLNQGKYASFTAKFLSYFHSKASCENSLRLELIASTCKLHYLRQPLLHFNRLCEDDNTKIWIEETHKYDPIFLVVGLLTVTDATVNHSQHGAIDAEVAATVPLTTPPTAVDIGLQFQGGAYAHTSASFMAEGERVIGIQYRKVKVRRVFLKQADKPPLEGSRWVMYLGEAGEGHLKRKTERC